MLQIHSVLSVGFLVSEPFSSEESKESLSLCYLYTRSLARMVDSMITLSSSKDQPGRTEGPTRVPVSHDPSIKSLL